MARSYTSITMDREILKWIEKSVKKRVFSSHNYEFEYAVRELMKRDAIRGRPRPAMQIFNFNVT